MDKDEVRGWEKEFDKKFVIKTGTKKIPVVGFWITGDRPDYEDQGCFMAETVKDFISTLLAKKREACESVPRYYGNPKAKEMVYLEDVIKILS